MAKILPRFSVGNLCVGVFEKFCDVSCFSPCVCEFCPLLFSIVPFMFLSFVADFVHG